MARTWPADEGAVDGSVGNVLTLGDGVVTDAVVTDGAVADVVGDVACTVLRADQ